MTPAERAGYARRSRAYRRRLKAKKLGIPVEQVVMRPVGRAVAKEPRPFADGTPAPRLKGRKFSLHLDDDMYRRIRMVGQRHGTSFNETIAMLCEWGLEDEEG